MKRNPSKSKTPTQSCFRVGSASKTLYQHENNIGWKPLVGTMSLTWLSWSVTSDVISFWVTTLMSEGLPCFDARFTDLRCVFSTDVLLFICDNSSFSSWSSCNSCMLFLAWRHHPAQWTVSHPYHAKLIHLISQPLEVVDRGLFNFSTTWSCVSLTRSTTSSGWILL